MTDTKTTTVDLSREITAMADFLQPRWSGIPSPNNLFKDIQELAYHDGRAWVDRYALSDVSAAREVQRRALLESCLPEEQARLSWIYDQPCAFLNALSRQMDRLYEAGMSLDGEWDYEKRTKQAYTRMLSKYPELSRARPSGWEALYEGYTDFDGMTEYCESQQSVDEAEFQGTSFKSTIGGGFVGRTALPYVMYDEVCQGRKAALVLVSAVYSHFLMLRQAKNTEQLLEGFAALELRDQEPNMVHSLNLASDNKLVQALLLLVTRETTSPHKTENERREAFAAACAAQKPAPQLSQEDHAAVEAARAAHVKALLSRLRKPSEDEALREKARKLELLTACKAVLSGIET